MSTSSRRRLSLLALLGVAAALRLAGIEWGFPRCYHPDEWIYTWNAALMLERGSLAVLSKPPERRYVNPTGFVYASGLACAFVDAREKGGFPGGEGTLDRYRSHRAEWHLVARLLSAALGVAAVALVFACGRELERGRAPRGTAVIAAALVALSPLHVRDSHFGTNDTAASAVVALGVLAALRYARAPSARGAVLLGASVGIAVATKYNTGLLFLTAIAALGDVALAQRRLREAQRDFAIVLATTVVSFLTLCPAPLIDTSAFVASFRYQSSLASAPYQGQEPIASWLFHLRTLALALGPAGLVASVAGLAVLTTRRLGVIVTLYPLSHLIVFVSIPFAFARVDVPALPPLVLAAGFLIARALDSFSGKKSSRFSNKIIIVVALTLVFLPQAFVSVRIDHLLRESDTRRDAEAWLESRLGEHPLCAFDPEAQRGVMPLAASGDYDPALPQPISLATSGPTVSAEVVDRLSTRGVRYVVLTEDADEPLGEGGLAFLQALKERADLVLWVDAGPANAHVPYSSEERYAPFEHVFARVRPGPPVRIYELRR